MPYVYAYDADDKCHCGDPIYIHEDDGFTRGLCEDCDAVRCDAYPGACRVIILDE